MVALPWYDLITPITGTVPARNPNSYQNFEVASSHAPLVSLDMTLVSFGWNNISHAGYLRLLERAAR